MMRMITVLGMALAVSAANARADLALKDSDAVMFFGDRLVLDSRYPILVESFIRAKYPNLQAHFLANAQPNDTPETLKTRLPRDVFQLNPKPTIAVLCFGAYLTGRRALQPGQADEFGQSLGELAARLVEEGCSVILMTPPSSDESRNRQLREISFNAEVLTPLCDQIRKVAEARGFALIDWYAATEKVRAEREEKVPGFALSQDGLTPTTEGQALAATLLLEHWGAAPINERIDLDWATGQVASTAGKVLAEKNDEGGYSLRLEGFPLPWPGFSGRGARMSEEWQAAKMNHITLTVADVPDTGLMLGDERKKFPVLPDMLRKGLNLAAMEPMISADEAENVWRYITTKNRLWDKQIQEMSAIPEHPQLLRAHASLVETYRLYYRGYHDVLTQTPRGLSMTLIINPISPTTRPATASPQDPRLRPPDPADPADQPLPDEARKPYKVEQ